MIPLRVRRIIKVIEDDTNKKIAEILKNTRMEEEKIKKEYEEIGKREKIKILNEFKNKASSLRKKEISNAKIKALNEIKKLKSEIIDNLIKNALKRMREKNYEEILKKLIKRGLKELGEKEIEVFVNKGDFKIVEGILKKENVKFKIKEIETFGGCLIKSGKRNANYLFENLLENKRNEIEMKLSKILFD